MDAREHFEKFQEIIQKYGLADRADDLADFITGHTSLDEYVFSKEFGVSEEDSKIFLAWIKRGIEFKEQQIDSK